MSVHRTTLTDILAEEIGESLVLYPARVDPVAQSYRLACCHVEEQPTHARAAHPETHSSIFQSSRLKIGVALDAYVSAGFAWLRWCEGYWRGHVRPALCQQGNQSFEVFRRER